MRNPKVYVRILAMLLSLTLVIPALSIPTFALSPSIDGLSGDRTLEDNFSLGQSADYNDLVVRPGDEIRIPLTADMFTWIDERTSLPLEAIHSGDLKDSRVTVRTLVQKGSIVLDYVQFSSDSFSGKPFFYHGTTTRTSTTACISVMFTEELVSVSDQEFSITITVLTGTDSMEITLDGKMVVDKYEVDPKAESIDLSSGIVAEPTNNIMNVKVYAGNGITIDRNLYYGKCYYATSQIKAPTDRKVQEDYPEVYPVIEAVYMLNTVNMRTWGDPQVDIKIPDGTVYYVYGDDMAYLGTTAEKLPFSDLYILSKLEIPTLESLKYEQGLKGIPITNKAG